MKMQKKKIKLYLVFVIALFIFVLYFSLKDNYMAIINTLSKVNIVYLLLGILFVFISKYLVGITLYYLAKKEKKNTKLNKMLQIAFIYPFFAGITPSSVGGESFEVFYLKDTGIPYGKSSNISIQKFILYEISLIIVDFIAVILNLFTDVSPNNSLVASSVAFSFCVNIVILVFLFLLTYNKKFNHFIMNKGLLFLHKIKIVKDLKSTARQQKIANARHIAVYLAREVLQMSYESIGEFFNKKHTTIMYSYEMIADKLKTDSELKSVIDELKTSLRG